MVLAMILAMGTTVFATNITFNGEDGRTYVGYKIFNLTTSLKPGDACPEGTQHTDACYNYAYTVNEKYREILQAETLAKAEDEVWEDGKPTAADDVTDAEILTYISKQTKDNNGTYGTMRDVADRLYREIKDQNIEADEKNLSKTGNDVAQGYWLFADVTDLNDTEKANSLVMVNTAGQNAITITPKAALPTIEKKVKDINDSTDNDTISNNEWADTADHDILDTVPFKLTATLPSNFDRYDSYKLVFHDDLSDGLTLKEGTIKVYMYADKDAADADTAVTAGTVLTLGTDYTINATPADDCSFEVALANVKKIANVTKDSAFVVYYEATLNNNAAIGAAGNPNEVKLEFSNDPYSDATGVIGPDEVKVFTYQLVINKIDGSGNALPGAGFTLYKKGADGKYAPVGAELKSDGMTTFTWTGLDDGDYKLVESTVPAGYNKMNDKEFTITAAHDETTLELTSLSSTLGETEQAEGKFTGTIEEDITNYTGTVLPETGAMGTFLLILGSVSLIMIAGVFMVTRKKMSVYED